MQSASPFREPHDPACVELRCHACAKRLFVPTPEAAVSLTRCPQPECQRVALVCTGSAMAGERRSWARHGCAALALETFAAGRCAPAEPGLDDALVMLGPFFIIFLLCPLSMWAYAWQTSHALFAAVVAMTALSVLMGLGMLVLSTLELWSCARERRELRRVRAQAFARAPWLPARARLSP